MKLKRRIPVANPEIGHEELANVIKAVKEGWISSRGEFINEFEKLFASFIGVRHAIACSSGTAALHLALLALGIKHGDEVLVPDITFAAPANMVIAVGAKPVFVDVNKEYWCIEPDEIRRKVTPKTKAIIVVHLYGHPAKMDEIMEIAEDNGLYVIEDCAEAHGAKFKGKIVGSIGHIGCFSFYANKIMTTGEGGMVTTNDDEIADKVRLYRDHGMRPRYWHIVPGFNYRMTNLQAAIGVAQVKKLPKLIERKRWIAKTYRELLEEIPGIRQHPEMEWAYCVYWLYSILIEDSLRITRDDLMRELEKEGIETRYFFKPLHMMPAYKEHVAAKENFPVSTYLAERGLNLPSGPRITEEEIMYVANTLRKIIGRYQK
ncbi:MAG: aminotransferase DegT [Thermoprotei archaeon]|nr:MAG: aminotransferase DegT [Thermoprotei archaeon]